MIINDISMDYNPTTPTKVHLKLFSPTIPLSRISNQYTSQTIAQTDSDSSEKRLQEKQIQKQKFENLKPYQTGANYISCKNTFAHCML
uniref:Uncharacterized protein n=1 Tax=Setaria italica TaxID=4555 RepID=K3XNS4_SETIT